MIRRQKALPPALRTNDSNLDAISTRPQSIHPAGIKHCLFQHVYIIRIWYPGRPMYRVKLPAPVHMLPPVSVAHHNRESVDYNKLIHFAFGPCPFCGSTFKIVLVINKSTASRDLLKNLSRADYKFIKPIQHVHYLPISQLVNCSILGHNH